MNILGMHASVGTKITIPCESEDVLISSMPKKKKKKQQL
jgi:hypothetical protein